ncbi:hypothetical protein FSP39_023796 [Pinctada imbricata]|uniref:MD-2-related lipid-recognition domain-containing protein n=1 Tax=Pinctada imbricata TaxID=66713 RepID=A0AA89C033_PINIB|nr:hypothetical protein FSP39_023796 [Pinctada imbricata]
MAGNISYTLPRRLSIKLEVTKYWIGIPIMVPCFDKVGSCTYENICSNLEVYERRKRCPKRIRKYKLPCYCPFQAGEFRVKDLAINIPKIGGYAGALVKGDYGVVVKLLDENYDELGCVDMKFSMKKRHRGWLFRI